MGLSVSTESWPAEIDLPHLQLLNGGVEGAPLERSLQRFFEIRRRIPLAGVVLLPGWHNMFYGRTDGAFWQTVLNAFAEAPFLAICSIPTCLTEECGERGIIPFLDTREAGITSEDYFSDYYESLNSSYFNFWGSFEPSLENVRAVLRGVTRYNTFLKHYAETRGHLFIDLRQRLMPESYDAVPRDFFDVCHPRPRLYPLIGAEVTRAIQNFLATDEGR
jgi:hypothetical protein